MFISTKPTLPIPLITSGRYYFLARPRRFGKSLFLDTLSEIFKGSKHLFECLAIYDKWNWQQQSPVIRISFAVGDFSSKSSISIRLKSILNDIAADFTISEYSNLTIQPGDLFRKIIKSIYTKYKQKVVILIDEYDKPILDNIHLDDKTAAKDARDILREFYSAIKDSDEFLRFVFITGVSKFSKLNLFSDLKNIEDITIDKNYATITGYTQHDLESEFGNHFVGFNLNEIKRWYNGYNYFGEPVYNPFDILLFLSKNGEYLNYWWQTGNPSFLIELLKKGNFYLPELENAVVSEERLNAFDVEAIDIIALLWQTGYLTFKGKQVIAGRTNYILKIPNFEIQISLNALFFDYLANIGYTREKYQNNIALAIINNDIEKVKNSLTALFASIPYTNFTNNALYQYEGYYASVIYTFFASLGFEVVPEDITNHGRIDMTLKAENAIFIFEFKVDMPSEIALQQIKTKRYFEKYISDNKPIYLIGIHFSSSMRNIQHFESEIINGDTKKQIN